MTPPHFIWSYACVYVYVSIQMLLFLEAIFGERWDYTASIINQQIEDSDG